MRTIPPTPCYVSPCVELLGRTPPGFKQGLTAHQVFKPHWRSWLTEPHVSWVRPWGPLRPGCPLTGWGYIMQDVLRWLPAEQRMSYMIASLVWRCLLDLGPVNLLELFCPLLSAVELSVAPLIPTRSSPCPFCPQWRIEGAEGASRPGRHFTSKGGTLKEGRQKSEILVIINFCVNACEKSNFMVND